MPRQEVIRPAHFSTVAIAERPSRRDGSTIVHHDAMAALILSILGALRSCLRTRADLTIENLALRQQLANLRRTSGRTRLRNSDRAFWVVLSRLWSRWADVLVVVKADTVVRWHRAGFRLFWRWKSRSGRPSDGGI